MRVDTAKAIALLAHLAVTGASQRRETLVGLLWPESDQQHGRAALRRTLSALNKALAGDWILADRDTIRLEPAARAFVDVLLFRDRLAARRTHGHRDADACPDCLSLLGDAVTLYGGDFLQGFSLRDSVNFDDWHHHQGELLRQELDGALDWLARGYAARGEYEIALEHARRRLAADPLNEAAHCQLMELYAWAGQRPAALRQYGACARTLHAELGATPQRATTSLYRDIAAGRIGPETANAGWAVGLHPSPVVASPPEQGLSEISRETQRFVTVLCVEVGARVQAGRDGSLDGIALTLRDFAAAAGSIVARHGGELHSLIGSSIVAVFGAVSTRESDPEHALRAALKLRDAAARLGLSLSAGLSTGEILVTNLGGRPQAALMGPPADAARRLGACALPGEILAGEPTRRLAARAFEFARPGRDLGTLTAYRVEHPLSGRGRDVGREGFAAELIGRRTELVRLAAALAEVRQGRGQMVSLIGEAGVGKSRLIAELRTLAAAADNGEERPAWLEGRCLEMDTLPGYAPFIDMFQAHFGFRAEETDEDRCSRVGSALAGMAVRGDLPEERCEQIAPLLCRLLSLGPDHERQELLQGSTAEQLKQETFLAVRDYLVALARQRSVILIFEDLHWADGLSLDLISLLMEAVRERPLLLLCAYRLDGLRPQHRSARLGDIASRKCRDRYTELRLSELTHDESAQLVASLLNTASLPFSARELILERCQGNPFFIEETVQALLESGLLYEAGGVWQTLGRLDRSALPPTIQQVILDRMDRLDGGLRQVLGAASVIGRVFGRRILELAAGPAPTPSPGLGPADLDRDLWALEDRGLIYEERAVPELEYSFRHVLVQEAIYQSLADQQRAAVHGRVAEAMEALYRDNLVEHCEQLAHHAAASGDAGKAVLYLLQAGEKAKQAYDNPAAIEHFTRALGLLMTLPAGPDRDQREMALQLAFGMPLVHTRGHAAEEVQAAYARAYELSRDAGDAVSRFYALLGLRRYHLHRGELSNSLELDEQLMAAAHELLDPAYLARAHGMCAETLTRAGQFQPARQHAELAREAPADPAQRRAQSALFGNDTAILGTVLAGWADWYLGYPDRALSAVHSALVSAREANHPFNLVVALYWKALLHRLRRETPAAREMAQALLEVAQGRAYALFAALGTIEYGSALAAGDPRAGIERIRDGVAMCEAAGIHTFFTGAHVALAEAWVRAGQPDAGLSVIAEGIALVEETGGRQWEAELWRLQGELLALARARDAQAEACFQRAMQMARGQQARSLELRAGLGLARLWQRQGRRDDARRLLEPLYAWFSEGFATADLRAAREFLEAAP